MRVLTDFHHSTLLRSLYMLFEDRLGYDLFRPIGMEWWHEGFWAINNLEDTAKQYLSLQQIPSDGTPPLNDAEGDLLPGGWVSIYKRESPQFGDYVQKAASFDYFKTHQFDILIASIPAHIPLFQELIRRYQPQAKLIVQIGNEWPSELFRGLNVLASIKERPLDANVFFYHQEFDTSIFRPAPMPERPAVYSFINILQNMPQGWQDFEKLERQMPSVSFKSFGGQCRDGNIDGAPALAAKMHEASIIFHVKDGGDGYGHILHNAYACGRPVITRSGFYRGKLGEDLLVPGTFIDLDDGYSLKSLELQALLMRPAVLEDYGRRAAERFTQVVDFNSEAEGIKSWLTSLT